MQRADYIRKVLFSNDGLTAREIKERIVELCPDLWNDKVAFYADAGKDKSNTWVDNQLTAEVSSSLIQWCKQGKVILSKNEKDVTIFTATDHYKNSVDFSYENNVDNNIIIEEYDEEDGLECGTECGYVYLMESTVFSNTYKIGESVNYEKREYELSKDNRYGVFGLKTISYIKVRDRKEMEKLLHHYFYSIRLYKKTSINVDTELFKTDGDLPKEFKNFITNNFINNSFNDEILEYQFS
jgi:hypothetical protein